VLRDNTPRALDVAQDLARRHRIGVLDVYEHALKGSRLRSRRPSGARSSGTRGPVPQRGPVIVAFQQTLPTGINRINAENKTNTGPASTWRVIDTGIDPTHPDLQGNIVGARAASARRASVTSTPRQPRGRTIAASTTATASSVSRRAPSSGGAGPQLPRIGDDFTIVCGIDFVDSKSPAKAARSSWPT